MINILSGCRLFGPLCLAAFCIPSVFDCSRASTTVVTTQHPVFAHYMVCFATYGETVEGYKREISEAQAAGIDGFALNEGAWTNEPHYVNRTRMIFQAAHELNTGFKLIFSLDLATLKPIYIPEMLRSYANDPAYYHYNGRPLVSTFSGGRVDWKAILDPLRAEGINVCFVPFFYPTPADELPSYQVIKETFSRYSDVADGYFYFGAAGTAEQLADCNTLYVKAAREQGTLVMSSFTPFYWGAAQRGRRYFETEGGIGIQRQWTSILASQPDFVEIVTWNDFNESYIAPVADAKSFGVLPRRSHEGYLALTKYFIEWYKSGRQPKIARDSLVAIYRIHPKAAVAAPQPVGLASHLAAPVTDFRGDVQDDLYVTTMLTSPGELRVSSGGTETRREMGKGYNSVAIPFHVGAQHFALYRKGKLIAQADGDPICEVPSEYNFFPANVVATAK